MLSRRNFPLPESAMWNYFESDVVEPFRRMMHGILGNGWVLKLTPEQSAIYNELIRRRERMIFMPATILPSAGLRVRHAR